MKINWYLLIMLTLVIPLNIKADVKLDKCIDGDTFKVVIDNETSVVRLLSIDTPELNGDNAYAESASTYTCNALTDAKEIKLVKDNLADRDRYGRLLRWVYVDGDLLQAKLINSGYAKVAYLYDDYKYNDYLKALETKARLSKVGIWSDNNYYGLIIVIVILLILLGFKKRDFWLIKKIMLK